MFARFSVKKPFTVLVGVVLVIILGVVAFLNMTPDLLPDLDLPYAVVVTSYAGATPEQVETVVTKPVEQSMATLDNIKNVSSSSSENVSVVILEFTDGADMSQVTTDIREKLDMISGYWDDYVGTPYILKINPNMLATAVVAVDMEGLSGSELTSFVEDDLLSELEGIEGVASVSTSGMIKESLRITLSQSKIDALNEDIRASVMEKFDEAQQELDDSRKEVEESDISSADIESGKDELADAKEELKEQLADAKAQLNEKQAELIEGKMQLLSAQSELEAQLTELKTQRKQMVELKESSDQLESAKTQLEGGIAALKQTKTQYDGLTASREAAIETAKLDPALAALSDEEIAAALYGANPDFKLLQDGITAIEQGLAAQGTPIEAVPAAITAMEGQLATVQNGLAQIDTALASYDMKRSGLGEAINKMDDGIDKMHEGLDTIEETLQQLEDGQISLNEAFAQVEEESISATLEISDAGAQLIMGEAMLEAAKSQLDAAKAQFDSAQEQLDDAKETALKAADLSDKLTISTLSSILTAQHFSMPAGYVQDGSEDVLLRVGDKFSDIDGFAGLVLFDTGMDDIGAITVSDVAEVELMDNSSEVYASINGSPGVLLTFSKQSNYATADVSDSLLEKFSELESRFPGLRFTSLMDQGEYIRIVVDSVLNNLLLGAALAVIILIFFLRDLRPTFIVACSIPISVTFALVLMYFSGVTLNIISLAGLATGVGMLVDNSIVVIENVYRLRAAGVSPAKSAVSGTVQVSGAITSSTLTTVCVFFPIVFVEGLTKQLFTDMALTIGYSLLASLVIALTLIPAMAPGVLKRIHERASGGGRITEAYKKSLRWSLSHRAAVLVLALALLAGSAALALSRGFTYMPSMASPQLMVNIEMPEDSALEDTAEVCDGISGQIRELDGVDTVGSMLSGGMLSVVGISGDSGGDVGSVTMYVLLNDSGVKNASALTASINDICSGYDCEYTVAGGAESSAMSMLTGSGVSIEVTGDDLADLQASARRVADVLETVEGAADVSDGIEGTSPEISVSVNKNKAAENGLTVAQIYAKLSEAVKRSGTAVTVTSCNRDYDIIVASEKAEKLTSSDIRNYEFEVTDAEGESRSVRLGDIASVSEGETLSTITRNSQRRYLTVSASIAEGHNVSVVSTAVEAALTGIELPDGVSLEFSGENESIMDAIYELLKMLGLGVVFVYLIMVAQFQSLRSPFIVMFTIPLAFTGGLAALWLAGMEVSVIAMIGFVMLVGIIVNNGIVLVDYINQLRISGTEKREAIVEAGATRLRPIFMTALTTILGLLPIALGIGMGAGMVQPVAITCIGGLAYATLMTLYVVPVIYDLMGRKKMRVVSDEELEITNE